MSLPRSLDLQSIFLFDDQVTLTHQSRFTIESPRPALWDSRISNGVRSARIVPSLSTSRRPDSRVLLNHFPRSSFSTYYILALQDQPIGSFSSLEDMWEEFWLHLAEQYYNLAEEDLCKCPYPCLRERMYAIKVFIKFLTYHHVRRVERVALSKHLFKHLGSLE